MPTPLLWSAAQKVADQRAAVILPYWLVDRQHSRANNIAIIDLSGNKTALLMEYIGSY